jgi:putative ABC transport system permease protein
MALFPAEVLVELYTILGDARDLLAAIAVATQALVIVAILLAVFASLALRRRQLAVLRALGASRRYVFLAVWTHVSILIALGASFGLILGWLGAVGLSHLFLLKTGIVLPVMLGLSEIGIVLAVVAIGATLAAIPSWSSYRQSVSSALRA